MAGASGSRSPAWRARRKSPRPDPVFMLAGGPGQSALDSFSSRAPAFREVLRTARDPRRSAWHRGSHPLHCGRWTRQTSEATDGSPEGWRRAASAASRSSTSIRASSRPARRSPISTTCAPRLARRRSNLVGVSYGTRVALEYARRYPQRTRARGARRRRAAHARAGRGARAQPRGGARTHRRGLHTRCRLSPAVRGSARDADSLLERLRAAPPMVAYRDPLTDVERTELHDRSAHRGRDPPVRLRPGTGRDAAVHACQAAAGAPQRLMAQASMIESLVGEQIDLGLQLAVDLHGGCAACSNGCRRDARRCSARILSARWSRNAASGRAVACRRLSRATRLERAGAAAVGRVRSGHAAALRRARCSRGSPTGDTSSRAAKVTT